METSPAQKTPNEATGVQFRLPDGTLEVTSFVILIILALAVEVLSFFIDVILLSMALIVVLFIVNQNTSRNEKSRYEFSSNQLHGIFLAFGIMLYSWLLLVESNVSAMYDIFFVLYSAKGLTAILFYGFMIVISSTIYLLVSLYISEKLLHLATKSKNEKEWEYIVTSPFEGYKIILQGLITSYISVASLVVFAWWVIPINRRDYILSQLSPSTRAVAQLNGGNYWFVFPIFRLGVFLLLTAVSTMALMTYKFESYEKKNLRLLMSGEGFFGLPLLGVFFMIGIAGFLALYIRNAFVILGLFLIFSIMVGLIVNSKKKMNTKPRRHSCGRFLELTERECPYCVVDTRLAQYYIDSSSLSLLKCPICGEPKDTVSRSCKKCNGLIVTRCSVCQWVISPIWTQCIHCGSYVTPIPNIALSPREKPFASKTLIMIVGPLTFLIPTYILVLFSFVTIRFNPFNILFFLNYERLVGEYGYQELLRQNLSSDDVLALLIRTAIISAVLLTASIGAIIILFRGKHNQGEWTSIFGFFLFVSLFVPIISVFISWAFIVIVSLPLIPMLVVLGIISFIVYSKSKTIVSLINNYKGTLTFLHPKIRSVNAEELVVSSSSPATASEVVA